MNIEQFILQLLQEKSPIESNVQLQSLNYVEEGYIDSFGIFSFITEIEEKFNIEFSDDEIMSDQFQIFGELVAIIKNKLK